MNKLTIRLLPLLFFFTSVLHAQNSTDDLDRYVERLRRSYASGGQETAFMSAGADFLYGQDYFEAKNYSSAVWYFQDAVKKEKDNAFAQYQLAVSLLRQNDPYKTQQAQAYLNEAFRLNATLKERYTREVPAGKTAGAATTVPAAAPTAKAAHLQGLEAYLEELKYARATSGKETQMFSAGREVLYGYAYYEKGEYSSAESRFRQALAVAPDHPYIHYLLAVSQAAQGKKGEAQDHYDKAIAGDAGLKSSYPKDVAAATARHGQYEQSKKVKTTPAEKPVYGGALVFGKYTCHQTVWNGPHTSPAYSYKYHGYFELKKDGTYRWLDDGTTGRYSYDPQTGTVTFLSGHLATARSSRYQAGKAVPQITVPFTDSYRWECGCKK